MSKKRKKQAVEINETETGVAVVVEDHTIHFQHGMGVDTATAEEWASRGYVPAQPASKTVGGVDYFWLSEVAPAEGDEAAVARDCFAKAKQALT